MNQNKLLILSGWRKWSDPAPVRQLLNQFDPDWTMVIVGDCPTGLDPMARDIGRSLGFVVIRYVANWNRYDRAAGPLRNQEMQRVGLIHQRYGIQVYAGIYLHPDSKGTKDMHHLCQLGGFDIQVVYWAERARKQG